MNFLKSAALILPGFLVATGLVAQQGLNTITPDEGVWFSQYKSSDGGTLELTLTSIDGIGELELRSRRWLGIGSVGCVYLFELINGASSQTYLNTARSEKNCANEFQFATERTGPDSLVLNPLDSAPTFIGIDRVEMVAGLRPFRPEDARSELDNFDIIGFTTGVEKEVLEENLREGGYEKLGDPQVATGEKYKFVTEKWGRDRNPEGDFIDIIKVEWSAEIEDAGLPILSRQIARSWDIPSETAPSTHVLEKALLEKYGPATHMRGNRHYDREGNLPKGRFDACGQGTQQEFEYRAAAPILAGYSGSVTAGKISPYCGGRVLVNLQSNRDTGRASILQVQLIDPDMIWRDFWNTWSIGKREKIEDSLVGVRGATNEAPEL